MSKHESWRVALEANNQSSISVQTEDGSRVCACRYNWRIPGEREKALARAFKIAAAPQLRAALKHMLDGRAGCRDEARAVLKAADGEGA